MVYKDAEHHRIELRDQIGLAGQSLEVFPKHSLSAFSLVDLGFQLAVALLQLFISFSKTIKVRGTFSAGGKHRLVQNLLHKTDNNSIS